MANGGCWAACNVNPEPHRGEVSNSPLLRPEVNRAAVRPGRVEFAWRAQRIARVHHFGEIDAVNPRGPRYDYPARPLLGITPDNADTVRDLLLRHRNPRARSY